MLCDDERGDAVVVAEAVSSLAMASFSLRIGTAPSCEQPGQRAPGVQVLAAVDEVVGHEQHLAGTRPCTPRAASQLRISRG